MEEVSPVIITDIDSVAIRTLAQEETLKSLIKLVQKSYNLDKTHGKKVEDQLKRIADKLDDPTGMGEIGDVVDSIDGLDFDELKQELADIGETLEDNYKEQVKENKRRPSTGPGPANSPTNSREPDLSGKLDTMLGGFIGRMDMGFGGIMAKTGQILSAFSLAALIGNLANLAENSRSAGALIQSFGSSAEIAGNFVSNTADNILRFGMNVEDLNAVYNEHSIALNAYQRATGRSFAQTVSGMADFGDIVGVTSRQMLEYSASEFSRQRLLGQIDQLNQSQMQNLARRAIENMTEYSARLGIGIEEIDKAVNGLMDAPDTRFIMSSLSLAGQEAVKEMTMAFADAPEVSKTLRDQLANLQLGRPIDQELVRGLASSGLGDVIPTLTEELNSVMTGDTSAIERLRNTLAVRFQQMTDDQRKATLAVAQSVGGTYLQFANDALSLTEDMRSSMTDEQRAAERRIRNQAAFIREFNNRLTTMFQGLLTQVLNYFVGFDDVNKLFNKEGEFTEEAVNKMSKFFSDVRSFIDGFVSGMGTVFDVLKVIGSGLLWVADTIGSVMSVFGVETESAANTLGYVAGLLVGGIMFIATPARLLFSAFKTVGQILMAFDIVGLFKTLPSMVRVFSGGIIKATTSAFSTISGGLARLFTVLGPQMLNGVSTFLNKSLFWLGAVAQRALPWLLSRIPALFGPVGIAISTLITGIIDGYMNSDSDTFIGKVIDSIMSLPRTFAGWIYDMVDTVAGWLGFDSTSFTNALRDINSPLGILFDLLSFVGQQLSAVGDWVAQKWDAAKSWFTGDDDSATVMKDTAKQVNNDVIEHASGVAKDYANNVKRQAPRMNSGNIQRDAQLIRNASVSNIVNNTRTGNVNNSTFTEELITDKARADKIVETMNMVQESTDPDTTALLLEKLDQLISAQTENNRYSREISSNTKGAIKGIG
ncbi:MAG: hypothetical protein CMN60_20520 [Sphingobium sp.]|nr:hypothetical protein [Sphingobium sp.]|tara:strand:- start:19542 stop:22349 length:2808 start_codon:yes stop_codon:yes gene_type:complete